MKKISIYGALVGFLLVSPAQAQRFDSFQLGQRVAQLEQQILNMQQQNISGGGSGSGAARSNADIGRVDEELRILRGQIEQTQYQIDQLQKQISAMQQDSEFRFQELSGNRPVPKAKGNAGLNAPLAPQMAQNAPAAQTADPYAMAATASSGGYASAAASTAPRSLQVPAANLNTARDMYDHARRLLKQMQYEPAEEYFLKFTEQYPNDPLIGNAWYWLGETRYVRRDYVKSADSFRQGFEVMPDGPKAGDNLLKLAMSLAALQRNDEACIVLGQVEQKYAANSRDVKELAQREIKRLNCS